MIGDVCILTDDLIKKSKAVNKASAKPAAAKKKQAAKKLSAAAVVVTASKKKKKPTRQQTNVKKTVTVPVSKAAVRLRYYFLSVVQ